VCRYIRRVRSNRGPTFLFVGVTLSIPVVRNNHDCGFPESRIRGEMNRSYQFEITLAGSMLDYK